MENAKTVFIECKCGSHMVAIHYGDKEYQLDGEAEMCFWQLGAGHRYSLVEKLRHIWHIIKHGHPYTDFICLDKENVCKLVNVLTEVQGIDINPEE